MIRQQFSTGDGAQSAAIRFVDRGAFSHVDFVHDNGSRLGVLSPDGVAGSCATWLRTCLVRDPDAALHGAILPGISSAVPVGKRPRSRALWPIAIGAGRDLGRELFPSGHRGSDSSQ